jgi:ATP-binding cassette subfamily C (CFTR/MRP) protein 1
VQLFHRLQYDRKVRLAIHNEVRKVKFFYQFYLANGCRSWFGIRLDLLGSALVLIVLAVLICFRNFLPGFVTPAFVGLALSSLPGLTNTLSNMSQKLVDTETKLNSVERFYEYENLPQEAPAINDNYRPPSSWPQSGEIEFKNFSFAYTPVRH